MFESAELGHTIDKERFDKEEPEVRHQLLEAQYELVKKADFPVVIILAGVDGAGVVVVCAVCGAGVGAGAGAGTGAGVDATVGCAGRSIDSLGLPMT